MNKAGKTNDRNDIRKFLEHLQIDELRSLAKKLNHLKCSKLREDQLQDYILDQYGSRVIQAFIETQNVRRKKWRSSLVRTLLLAAVAGIAALIILPGDGEPVRFTFSFTRGIPDILIRSELKKIHLETRLALTALIKKDKSSTKAALEDYDKGKYAGAEKRLLDHWKQRDGFKTDIAKATSDYGNVLFMQYKYSKALKMYRLAHQYYETHPRYKNAIGLCHLKLGYFPAAIESFTSALASSGDQAEMTFDTALIWNNLGLAYSAVEPGRAIECHQNALNFAINRLAEGHGEIAIIWTGLGHAHHSGGSYTKALEYYSKALNTFQGLYESNHPDILSCMERIGTIRASIGEFSAAMVVLKNVLNIREELYGRYHRDVTVTLNNLGGVSLMVGNYQNALVYFAHALDRGITLHGETHTETVRLLHLIGDIYRKLGVFNSSRDYLKKAQAVGMSVYGQSHMRVADIWRDLGMLYYSVEDFDEAKLYFSSALVVYQKYLDKENEQIKELKKYLE